MSSLFSQLIRVCLASTQRASYNHNHQPSSSPSSRKQQNHYQHGIPGIPNDGKVVLLKNSNNGSQVYLVGTVHDYKETAQTVKKVINYVRPDIVAIELCYSRGNQCLQWASEDDDLYTLYEKSKRAPGGLFKKVGMYIRNCLHLLYGEVISPNSEFRVAIEEAARVGARCFFIDENINVTNGKLGYYLYSSDSNLYSYEKVDEFYKEMLEKEDYSRSLTQNLLRFWKDVSPETFKVLIFDRDKHMFMQLRRFQGKIVAVVGMAHMDGIEQWWKYEENPANQKRELVVGSKPSPTLFPGGNAEYRYW